MDREAWLKARRSGIGGSDAPVVCGLSAYVTELELYFDKTGEAVIEREDTERMQMGRALEDTIANVFAQRYDVKLRRHAMRRHPRFPWMIGNPDRLIEGARIGLEIKNVDSLVYRYGDWGEPDTDEIPDPYLLQCLHYAILFDYREWHLAALVGGNTLKRYIVRRNRAMEEDLIDAEREFWRHVERREPPAIDFARPGALALVKRLYPGTNGATLTLPDEAVQWHGMRVQAANTIKQCKRDREDATGRILAAMGEAAIGRLPGGGEYRRRQVNNPGSVTPPYSYIGLRFSDEESGNDE